MTTKQILSLIWENKLDRNLSKKEIKDWIKSYFSCTNYVANKVVDNVYYNKNLYCY